MSKLERLKSKTFYEILNVEKTATSDLIKASYKEIAKIYHPDSNFFSEIIPGGTDPEDDEVFKYITHAYNTLLNAESRTQYDKTLPPDLPDWEKDVVEEFHFRPKPPERQKSKQENTAKATTSSAPQSKEAFQNQMERLRSLQRQQAAAAAEDPSKVTLVSSEKIRNSVWYIIGALMVILLLFIILIVLFL